MKEYKPNKSRIASLWLSPILFLLIIGSLIFITNKLSAIVFSIALALLLTGPFFHLFFNHLKLAAATKINFEEKRIEITQFRKVFSFYWNDIIQIIEYSSENKHSTRSPMWGDILKNGK
ncbi:MAG: hypothetical protein H7Y86_06075 [Rhizobacter sp.]|nr:hypothetical protein [Ferruginibacter sp.]